MAASPVAPFHRAAFAGHETQIVRYQTVQVVVQVVVSPLDFMDAHHKMREKLSVPAATMLHTKMGDLPKLVRRWAVSSTRIWLRDAR